ncbi:hypothetical protein BDZ89DRAFT_186073 [Hymenopellis radicata]|nr:hypothetical protein BDZ89DRAFT_186073 [Hymenopellis radicata]
MNPMRVSSSTQKSHGAQVRTGGHERGCYLWSRSKSHATGTLVANESKCTGTQRDRSIGLDKKLYLCCHLDCWTVIEKRGATYWCKKPNSEVTIGQEGQFSLTSSRSFHRPGFPYAAGDFSTFLTRTNRRSNALALHERDALSYSSRTAIDCYPSSSVSTE